MRTNILRNEYLLRVVMECGGLSFATNVRPFIKDRKCRENPYKVSFEVYPLIKL